MSSTAETKNKDTTQEPDVFAFYEHLLEEHWGDPRTMAGVNALVQSGVLRREKERT